MSVQPDRRKSARTAPSILLIDDGELVRVRYVLERLQVSFEHRSGMAAEEGVVCPQQLLVASARRAQMMPDLEMAGADSSHPVWVCAHAQDFLPMRQRLKELGFHYLIHSQIDREVIRLFFLQLLHRGGERRRNVRLPMVCELNSTFDDTPVKGRLDEISQGGCRLVTAEEVAVGAAAVVYLPPELARGEELALNGTVKHCSSEAERSGGEGFSAIVVFGDLDLDAEAQIQSILEGGNLGTRITPLEPIPDPPCEALPEKRDPKPKQRRVHERRHYPRRLTALQPDSTDVVLGRDLSMTGIRIERDGTLAVGDQVSIALYAAARDEPMIVDAEVLREDQEGLGLRFVSLSPKQRAWLERILEHLPTLESLVNDAPDGEPLVVSKLVRSDD